MALQSSTAQAVLTLAAAGAPVPEVLVDELARSVLAEPDAELARQVQDGGPHKLMRAVELAEMLLVSIHIPSDGMTFQRNEEPIAAPASYTRPASG